MLTGGPGAFSRTGARPAYTECAIPGRGLRFALRGEFHFTWPRLIHIRCTIRLRPWTQHANRRLMVRDNFCRRPGLASVLLQASNGRRSLQMVNCAYNSRSRPPRPRGFEAPVLRTASALDGSPMDAVLIAAAFCCRDQDCPPAAD